MRLSKWLALLLCLCLLSSALPAALAEDMEVESEELEIISEEIDGGDLEIEPEVGEADPFGGEIDPSLFDEDEIVSDTSDAESTASGEDAQVDAPSGLDVYYARVTTASAPLYFDPDAGEAIAELAEGETVLVVGEADGLAVVALNVSDRIVDGFMRGSDLEALNAEDAAAYQANIAGSGAVVLYEDDLNWPLGPLGPGSNTDQLEVMSSNYDEMSNDTEFVLNGKKIRAGDEETKGSGNCWKWAQAIYKKIWGVNFGSDFEGNPSKGHNLIRNFTDEERVLTPDNLKYIIMNSKPGATLRVQSCPRGCSGIDTDGCSKHEKHSLIIAEIRNDGLVTMDDQGRVHTRFYTWQGFCNAWKKWKYVKYVKWPNAPALASMNSVDGYSVSDCSNTYKVRATASKGAAVCSLPENGKVLETLTYPATFTANKMAIKEIGGYNWVYGKSSTGVSGWLPLTDAVVDVKESIKVTGVTLNKTSMALLKGGKDTLKASIAPLDATNQEVSWTSSDTGVATVEGGVVTGMGAGTATITVTTADGSKKATCTVKVAAADSSKTLKKTGSNGTVKLIVGQELQLVPKFATKKGWKIKSVTSSKKKVATVDKKTGVVTAKAAGKTTITVKTKNGKKATLTVKVSDPNAPTKIYVSKTSAKLKKGETLKLYTKLAPETATTTLTWKSSKPKVASVDQEGNVIALKAGKCKIGVKAANGVYATVKIKVY